MQSGWGILAINKEFKVLASNTYLTEKLCIKCQPGDDLKTSLPQLFALLGTNKQCTTTEILLTTPAGQKEFLLETTPFTTSSGEYGGQFIILKDLENERNLRKVEHFAALGELSAAVAHEIRNPLTSIQGFLQLMDKKNPSTQSKEYIQIMLSELKRANYIISEFLQFARPPKLRLKKQSVTPIIEEVAKIMQAELALNGIHFNLAAQPTPKIKVDGEQIKQIFLNLFQNALQALQPEGQINVQVIYNQTSNAVTISIQDTGKGIPEENLNKIFTPFFTTKETGTGLGLSICRRIVQNHGGKLEVKSQLGQGTNFIITLPVEN